MKVIEKFTRAKLIEGRTQGLAFAFLKKVGEDFETVHPMSTCKDYLNDIVTAEVYNQPIQVFGLDYTPNDLFKDKTFYIGFKILKTKEGKYFYNDYNADVKQLKNNIPNILKLVNWFDDKFNVKPSEIFEAEDDYFVISNSEFWNRVSVHTSLYALLVRMGQSYDGEESVDAFLNNTTSLKTDQPLWAAAKPKVMLMLLGVEIRQPYVKDGKITEFSGVHTAGISYYNDFKIEDISRAKAAQLSRLSQIDESTEVHELVTG